MNAPVCSHERDVLDLVAIGQWPARADAELRAHVATCSGCAEVAEIAAAVQVWSERDTPIVVPEPSVVWHRAQMKARLAAARTASRPVWIAQAAALGTVVAGVAWMGPGAGWYASAWSRISSWLAWPDLGLQSLTLEQVLASRSATVLLAVGVLAVLATVAFGALRLTERSESSK
jgi:hypothetical protein